MNTLEHLKAKVAKDWKCTCDDCGHINDHYDMDDLLELIEHTHTQTIQSVRERVEARRRSFVPADLIWIGDEEQEVGEWKFVPKEDGMYCLNCERFIPEEGCACGMVHIDDLLKDLEAPVEGDTHPTSEISD